MHGERAPSGGVRASATVSHRWQAAAFALGLLSLAVALLSPVVWLSTVLFSVHMTQHEILMLVSAPLLVFGQPLFAVLWAFPRRTRESGGRWPQAPAVARSWRALTGPFAVFHPAGARALDLAHALALRSGARQRCGPRRRTLSFVLTASLFWWA